MLNIEVIRENADRVKAVMGNRNMDADQVTESISQTNVDHCRVTGEAGTLKAQQNVDTKQIPVLREEGKNATELMAQLKKLSDQIKEEDVQLSGLEEKQCSLLLTLPNIPAADVLLGRDGTESKELRRQYEPAQFGFEPKAHWDLGKEPGILDPETAAKVIDAHFHFYKGLGVRLERTIINFFLNTYTKNGCTEIFPSFMVSRVSMTGTGQLSKFEMDAHRVINKNTAEDYFLIPTAEVSVMNMHRSGILGGASLPIECCVHSACFRMEAGSAGHDTHGLIRQHQFNKMELIKFADPADSHQELGSLTNDAEHVLRLLGLPYRVVCPSTDDLGLSSAKTYDIEVWMFSYNHYIEVSSCSNLEDLQARRVQTCFKVTQRDKAQLVRTLNGSGVAVGRTVAVILGDHQNENGSITIPEILRPFMSVDAIKCPE